MATAGALPPEESVRGSMVLPMPPPGGFTAADLPRLIEAVDARFELLDGEVLMVAPAGACCACSAALMVFLR